MFTYETEPAGIPCECFTNLDDYRFERWPNLLACRPKLGDYVEAMTSSKRLRVVAITHTMNACSQDGSPAPCICIELHK